MNKNIITLNIGEWTEFYVFMKLLTDRLLFVCDKNLNYENFKIKIIEILKEQNLTNEKIIYKINNENIDIFIKNKFINTIPIKIFLQETENLLSNILNNKNRTFSINFFDKNFLDKIYNPKIKSSSQLKNDILIKVINPLLNSEKYYGFSIKSRFKNSSTILNASSGTNFIFNVKNIDFDKYKNLLGKDLVSNISNITFNKIESNIFNENLQMIDSNLPFLLSKILFYYFSKKGTKISDLIKILELENPLNYTDTNIYKIKISEFLLDIVLGMMPKTKWDGNYTANGGIIIAKRNGNLYTFYIVDRMNLLECMEYLFNNSYLDTPSISRHNFGFLYKENNEIKLKLNLQIRLK